MKIGVVVVTYNRLTLLKECISRVLNQSVEIDSVIIVNNNSNDGTKEYLDSLDDKRIRPYHEPINLGGAGGFHKALSIAIEDDFDYILIIDDDAMIERSYMAKITDFADKNRQYRAFAGSVYTKGEIDIYHRRRIGSKLLFYEQMIPTHMYDRPRAIDCATFCGLVIRGDELRRIGLPLKEYFIWYDDTEFCMRLSGGIALVPKAKINHKTTLNYQQKGLLSRISWKHYYGYRNRYDCAKRHLGKITCVSIIGQYIVFLIGSIMMLLMGEAKRKQGIYNIHMLARVLCDCVKKRLGVNEDFMPEAY